MARRSLAQLRAIFAKLHSAFGIARSSHKRDTIVAEKRVGLAKAIRYERMLNRDPLNAGYQGPPRPMDQKHLKRLAKRMTTYNKRESKYRRKYRSA